MPKQKTLTRLTIGEFLDELGSGSPAPGGGSTAALGAAAGASLISMVCNLTLGKKKYLQVGGEIRKCLANSEKWREALTRFIDEDTAAFNDLMSAYRLSRETPEAEDLRNQAVQKALNRTISVPLNVAKGSVALLELAKTAAEKGNVNSISDTGVAALMMYTALKGALYNVRINLHSVKDSDRKNALSETVNRLLKEGEELRDSVLAIVEEKLW
jgi:formiminotetrahydrofolate cyclodeaminase